MEASSAFVHANSTGTVLSQSATNAIKSQAHMDLLPLNLTEHAYFPHDLASPEVEALSHHTSVIVSSNYPQQLFPSLPIIKEECPSPTLFESGFDMSLVKEEAMSPEFMQEEIYYNEHMALPSQLPTFSSSFGVGTPQHLQLCCQETLESFHEAVMRLLVQDIHATCVKLGLSHNPASWTPHQVRAWVLDTLNALNLPVTFTLSNFEIPGYTLCCLTLAEFQHLAPDCGEQLKAALEMWHSALEFNQNQQHRDQNSYQPTAIPYDGSSDSWSVNFGSTFLNPIQGQVSPAETTASSADCPLSPDSGIATDGEEVHPNVRKVMLIKARELRPGQGHAQISLWQFIRQLLDEPEKYGFCVRWITKSQGIFKIESSYQLAKYWGIRKNRPAMNYDKLSRSLRQYYRKGILRKTTRSQRLVYQFCPPYGE